MGEFIVQIHSTCKATPSAENFHMDYLAFHVLTGQFFTGPFARQIKFGALRRSRKYMRGSPLPATSGDVEQFPRK